MIICVGPFVGDFETEILSFRPYVTWLYKNVKQKKFYVSSHYYSRFLYDFLEDEQFIPIISNELSDDKASQVNYFHEKIPHKTFLRYTRNFKSKVSKLTGVKKEDIKVIGISYTKLSDPIILAKKIFEKIRIQGTKGNYILYDKEPLIEELDYKLIGNCSSSYDLIELVSNAACVVCRVGFYTALANLQGTPVFGWAVDYPGRYRHNGIYNFGNKNAHILYCDDREDILKRALNSFLVGKL
ncbi:MAG: hypothetical protein WC503_04120 [Candidatus Shapirobacteria bacterium]